MLNVLINIFIYSILISLSVVFICWAVRSIRTTIRGFKHATDYHPDFD